MPETVLYSTRASGPFELFECQDCEESFYASADDKFCPMCFSDLPSANSAASKQVTASIAQSEPRILCSSCGVDIYSNSEDTNETLANTIYCPVCGSGELEEYGEDDEISEGENPKKDPKDKKKSSKKETKNYEEEIEDEAKEKLSSSLNIDEMEAALIASPEDSWCFFKEGQPMFRLVKSKVHKDAHHIFSSDRFLEVFQNRCKEVSVASAIKEFNGEVLDGNQILSSMDLENLAFEKLRSHVIPKFIDCVALAVEGAAKGVYANLNHDLKAAFFDEIVARGLNEADAQQAIEAAFYSAGTDAFSAIVSKAQELFDKEPSAFDEVKSTIQSSGFVRSAATNSEVDIEEQDVRSRLKGGNVPVDVSEPVEQFSKSKDQIRSHSVTDLRERISFRNQR